MRPVVYGWSGVWVRSCRPLSGTPTRWLTGGSQTVMMKGSPYVSVR